MTKEDKAEMMKEIMKEIQENRKEMSRIELSLHKELKTFSVFLVTVIAVIVSCITIAGRLLGS